MNLFKLNSKFEKIICNIKTSSNLLIGLYVSEREKYIPIIDNKCGTLSGIDEL